MKSNKKGKRLSTIAGIFMLTLAISSLSVSTYAWFQAQANVRISTTSTSTDVTVQAPEDVKFYYFTGNGTPGGDYSGYSRETGSNIGTAARTYATSSCGVTFDSNFVLIDSEDATNTPANCFNFSKLRPGCYYTFCAVYSAPSVGLNLSFTETKSGDGCTPKRRVYDNGVTGYPLSLAMAMNGYAEVSTKSGAANYIETAFAKGAAGATSDDTIVYDPSDAAMSFDFLENEDTTSSNYMYFTVYMGFNNKADALLYNSKAIVSTSEVLYYKMDQSSGDYSALEGLTMRLDTVEVTL